MKAWMWIVILILVALGGMWFLGVGPFATPATPATVMEETTPTEEAMEVAGEVVIQDFVYAPASLTVKAGETVKFTNKDVVSHTATADDGASFDTGLIGQNESAVVTFDTPGTYTYHCTPHPQMKGTIVVE
jgi:plastocyanin